MYIVFSYLFAPYSLYIYVVPNECIPIEIIYGSVQWIKLPFWFILQATKYPDFIMCFI